MDRPLERQTKYFLVWNLRSVNKSIYIRAKRSISRVFSLFIVPRLFLYIASLRSGIRSGLGLCIRLYRYASQLVRRQLNWSKLNKMRDNNNDARLRLHRTGSVWDRCQIGTHKSCIYTGPGRSALDRFSYPVPNGFTCESDLVWNCNVPGWHHARVNPTQFRRTLP